MAAILKVFDKFPEEGKIIGGLATAYAELEYDLCMCVAMAVNNLDMTVKALFRPRGETQRIDVADAIGRKPYEAWKDLGELFAHNIGAMRHCLKIRNNYAHCNWHDDNTGKLSFLNLEEIAEKNELIEDLSRLTFRYVDKPLLESQWEFFGRVSVNWHYLNYEGRKRAGKLSTHALQVQQITDRPPPYIPQ